MRDYPWQAGVACGGTAFACVVIDLGSSGNVWEYLMGTYRSVCRIDQLSEGQGHGFVVNDEVVCLVRIGDEVHALDDRCPHAGASLSRGYVEGEVVRCRIHHWGFRVRDGVYVDADHPSCNARSIPVRVVNGQVEVWVSE